MKPNVVIIAVLLLASIGMVGATAISPDILGDNGVVGSSHFQIAAIAYGPHLALPMNGSTYQMIAGDRVWIMNPDPAPVKTGKGVIGSFGQVPTSPEKWRGWI